MRGHRATVCAAFAVCVGLSSCGAEIEDAPPRPAAPGGVAPARVRGPAPAQLGAACWVPGDVSYFSSVHGLGELVEDLADSRAVQRFARLPMVAMGLGQLHAELSGELAAARRHPLARALLDLAEDAPSQELFVAAGAEWVGFADALLDVYQEAILLEIRAELGGGSRWQPDTTEQIVQCVLRHEDALRLPPLTFGCKLPQPKVAKRVLADLVAFLRHRMPLAWTQTTAGGGEYWTVQVEAGRFPGWQQQLRWELRNVNDALARRLLAFVESQRLVVSLGLRGDYLLLSLGSDSRHLGRFGSGASLAASPAFAGVRRHLQPDLLSLTYVSEQLRPGGKLPVDRWMSVLGEVLPAAPMAETMASDLRRFLDELNADLPEPEPLVAASFRHQGVEGWEFGGRSRTDARAPLDILALAGPEPLALVAQRSPPMAATWDKAAHWLGVAHGWFEKLAVPAMSSQERRAYERFRDTFAPACAELNDVVRDVLLPAVDGGQALLTVAPGGELQELPGVPGRLQRPLELVLPALVWEVHDTDQLVGGFARVRQIVNSLLERAAQLEHLRPMPPIPAPRARVTDAGTAYSYPMPPDLPAWLLPHALVTDGHLVLSLWPEQSAAIAATTAEPPQGLVDLTADAGGAAWIDVAGLAGVLRRGSDSVLQHLVDSGAMPRAEAFMASTHVDGLAELLSTCKGYSSRIFVEGGTEVRHSWLQIEDL